MSNISGQLIKDSFNYVLQSDLITGIVYRIGGDVPTNPKFISGLTINTSFTYSDGSEFDGYVLTCDASGNATWAPVSAATSGVFVTGGTFDYNAGTLQLRNSNGTEVTISGLEDVYVTGGTVSGTTVIFTYNDGNNFSVTGITPYNLFSSYTASTQTIINNKLDVSGFTAYTASTQPLILNSVTGGTYSNGTLNLINNSGGTVPITGFTSLVDGKYVRISGDTMTGRLNVPTLSAQTITASTVENVSYVDFNTGTTNPSASGGRMFFNNEEQSLSYYAYANSPVVVNTGQQLYLRVFNNTGSPITKGSVVTILSQFNGLPAITLAVNSTSGTKSLVAGLAAETIPSGTSGLTITNGILSGLNIPSTYTPGDTIYLDYDDAGMFNNAVPNFPLSARTNEVGYIIQTGTTTGKVYVNINNENIQLSLTDLQRNVLEGNVLSTGVFAFSGLSLVSASGTTFNISPVQAWIVENTSNYLKPTVQYITYSGASNVPATFVNTATQTYILLTSGGTILQQTTFPTPQQRRENVYLGKLGHANKTFLINAFNEPDFDVSPLAQLRDMFTPIRLINGGIYPSPNGVNLTFNTSAGVLYGLGIGWVTNTLNPDSISVSGTSPCTFQYRTQTGGTTTNTTTIIPGVYDNNGVITTVGGGSNSSTNQRIYLVQNGSFRMQYGQRVYSTLADAIANAQTESFTTFSNFRDNAILIGILSVNKNATNLSDTTQARFLLTSKFGETVGASGGISTTNLQQAYNNSVEPEILINSTLDGVSIQNGTGNADNVSQLLQGKNSGGTVTSFIRADGAISGHSVSADTIYATTYLNLPKDVFVTGGTYNSGTTTITFTNNTGGTFTVTGITAGSGGSGTSVTGGTFNYPAKTLTLNNSNGTSVIITGLTDTYVTGGTYNGSQITFTNNSGDTFVVSGLTATGFSANYYASFSDTTTQVVSGSNIATVWRYNTTEISNGISVVDNTKITVQNTGIYEIGYSAQIEKTQGTEANVTIWAKINGNDVDRSSSTIGLVSNSVYQLPFVSYVLELNAGDYVEFYFSSPSQYVQITTLSGLTSPTRPDSPSVIIVAKQVGLAVSAGSTGDTYVTGFTYDNLNINLNQNRDDEYSAFTITLTGLTTTTVFETYTADTNTILSNKVDSTTFNQFANDTSIALSNKLEISVFNTYTGATQTNLNSKLDTTVFTAYTASTQTTLNNKLDTVVFSSYTANTQPLILNAVTGGSYDSSSKTLNLINNSGLTIPITGFTTTDIFVTGGTYLNGNTTFTNNSGGTFTVTGSASYSSGILSGSSNWVSNGNGSVTLPTVQVALYNNSSYTEPVQVYTVTSGITGSGGITSLTDNDTNYVYIEYNNGSPRWGVSTDNSFINGSDIDLCYLIYRAGNFVHVLDFGNEGAGLSNKISNRLVATQRFARESGFSLGLSGVTGVVTLTSGVAWNGTNRQSLVAVNSQDDVFFKSFHSGGTWVYTTTGDTLNNTFYDDGTNVVSATASKYLVNWYFRGQEVNDHLYEVYGTDQYDSVAEAQLSVEPSLPELVTSHAFLTGRIIVQVGATTGLVESAFVQVFQSTQVTSHNDLNSIQGGSAGQYYHLTSSEYSNNAYTNVNNNFSTDQTINGSVSATTFSGDGSNLTNVQNIYNNDGLLSGTRYVDLRSNDLFFTSSTNGSTVQIGRIFEVYSEIGGNKTPSFLIDLSNNEIISDALRFSFNSVVYNNGDVFYTSANTDYNSTHLLSLDISNKVTKIDSSVLFNSISGGSYSSGTLSLVTNSGATISISGFSTGGSGTSVTSVTSVTESNNVVTVSNSNNTSSNFTIDAVTGGTYSAGNITLSGTGNVNGTQISTKILPVSLTVVSNTASTDASLSSLFTLTLTGNTTLATPTNGFSGQRILYRLRQDGTGNKLLTLSSGFRSGPITVTLSTAANTTDYLGVIYNEFDNTWDVLALNKGYN